MIASFSREFIFVKTKKTGGTSVEIVLSTWCSGADICTPIYDEDEVARDEYGGSAMNYLGPDGERKFFDHMPAAKIKAELPELWERAFKFTVERHPYEKVLSRAWWNIGRRDGDPERELAAEIDLAIQKRASYYNFPRYTIDGELAVDEVIPHDQLGARLAVIADKLGATMPTDMPRAKGRFRGDRRPAMEVLTTEQKDRIYHDAKPEFDLMGFER